MFTQIVTNFVYCTFQNTQEHKDLTTSRYKRVTQTLVFFLKNTTFQFLAGFSTRSGLGQNLKILSEISGIFMKNGKIGETRSLRLLIGL